MFPKVVIIVLVFALVASVVHMTPVEEQKPFDCPPNEVYYKCHLEVCFKKCTHLVNMPPCPSIDSRCYLPACECTAGYLRHENRTCVPEDNCPKP